VAAKGRLVRVASADYFYQYALRSSPSLTSRADSVRSRIASCVVAMLAAHANRMELQEA